MKSDLIYKADIRNAEIINSHLVLSLRLTSAYSPEVHSPKVTLVFESDNVSRYMPILVRTYYQNVDMKTCTIIAEYAYDLSKIFNEPIKNETVKVRISLSYGDEYIDSLPLEVSGDICCDDEFIIECNDRLEIRRKEPFIEEKINPFVYALKAIIGGIYYLFVRVIGFLFIPFLLLDSLMAYLGFKSGYVSKKNRTIIRYVIDYVRVGFKAITREDIGRKHMKKSFVKFIICILQKANVVPNRVTFLSNRRDDLSGNFEGVYDALKDDDSLEIKMLLTPAPMHRMAFSEILKFAWLYSTSKIVIIDDFYELTSMVPKKKEVKLVQIWHACGAFKTFGFSRLGKPGGPRQSSVNHRMYDRAIVSSNEIRRFYAEGFGIPIENVVATGVPRTDMFFDESVRTEKRSEFYAMYPQLKDKKIILFAPTFRGNGRLTGNYPMTRFDLRAIYESLNGEYAILVKMHPFVNDEVVIPKEYEDSIINFSENSELNDLLFITDILITDYSSACFEASLLDIPMIFYAYDLSEYIATRDFYYEYEQFIPGKLVRTQAELVRAIKDGDLETEKIEAFKTKFFDHLDGNSAQRVADMIRSLL